MALATTDTAPSILTANGEDDSLQIVATHRGRAGDTDAELNTLTLLLEESASETVG